MWESNARSVSRASRVCPSLTSDVHLVLSSLWPLGSTFVSLNNNNNKFTMFKKALAHQSNATPLRSSARRALVASVMASYPALPESLADRESDPSAEKDLGRALIPEGVRTATFETSAGIEGVSE